MSKLVSVTENPIESDTILFDIDTPDANGCYLANPYKVDSVIVYFVERDFASTNSTQYDNVIYDDTKLQLAIAADKNACANPTEANIAVAKKAREEANSNSFTTPFFYNKVKPVKIVGNPDFPAWLSTDTDNALIENLPEDEDGNTVYGQYQYSWDTTGMREGDYFVCWTWTPLVAGDKLSKHIKFNIGGNTVTTTSIPTHYTKPEKYNVLLERYLPEMFKMKMSDDDRSPEILEKFNKCIAAGFTQIENLANQIVDLLDANSVHEQFLHLLAGMFGLKLRSDDPTLWRRQIKNAIPLFKKKGTKRGLQEALAQAGITMTKLTRLWQLVSKYTWIETLKYDGKNSFWELSKVSLPVDANNFSLSIKPADENAFVELTSDYIEIYTDEGVSTVYWKGNTLSVQPIDLIEGDVLKILYKYKEIPDDIEQTLENYVRELPLADTRNEDDQDYPLKNWNVRVIEEDDPLFNILIPESHPFIDPIVFGKVRTEFAYSENAYNKDEYNGSLRNSKLPCDIDKHFIDKCSNGLSSKFNINLEIQNISNDRISEAQEIIKEYTPFHAVMHTMNFMGVIDEYLEPPMEEIELSVLIQGEESVIGGAAQMWFNRAMKKGTTTNVVTREDLADSEVVVNDNGIVYNDSVNIFCGEVNFDRIGMNNNGTAILEILSPSANSGTYDIGTPNRHIASVQNAIEPIDTANFTFNVSNLLTTGTLCNIYQDNLFLFSDPNNDFSSFDVKSVWDVDTNGASAYWTLTIPAYSATPFVILNVLPDGSLILDNNGSLPGSNATSITYSLNSPTAAVSNSTSGVLKITTRGKVEVQDSGLTEIRNFIRGNCYLKYNSNQYKIYGFVAGEDDQFYILNYNEGDTAGTNLEILQRLVDNKVGYLSYEGAKLRVSGDLETSLQIQNGHRNLVSEENRIENDNFKENFLVKIDGQNYFIEDIDGDSPSGYTTITLDGLVNYWKTFAAGGTAKSFSITHFTKKAILIQRPNAESNPYAFSSLDNAGREIITQSIITGDEEFEVLSTPDGEEDEEGLSEFVYQSEGINFTIEWSDGTNEAGKL